MASAVHLSGPLFSCGEMEESPRMPASRKGNRNTVPFHLSGSISIPCATKHCLPGSAGQALWQGPGLQVATCRQECATQGRLGDRGRRKKIKKTTQPGPSSSEVLECFGTGAGAAAPQNLISSPCTRCREVCGHATLSFPINCFLDSPVIPAPASKTTPPAVAPLSTIPEHMAPRLSSVPERALDSAITSQLRCLSTRGRGKKDSATLGSLEEEATCTARLGGEKPTLCIDWNDPWTWAFLMPRVGEWSEVL